MSSIVVLLALTLLATGCWYTHHWSGTHEQNATSGTTSYTHCKLPVLPSPPVTMPPPHYPQQYLPTAFHPHFLTPLSGAAVPSMVF